MDYRFNADYQMIITTEDRRHQTKTLISEKDSTVEMNRSCSRRPGRSEQGHREANGQLPGSRLWCRRLFPTANQSGGPQRLAEGAAEAASIKKMREAMMNEGGLIQVKMAIAESLRGQKKNTSLF